MLMTLCLLMSRELKVDAEWVKQPSRVVEDATSGSVKYE